MQPSQGYTAARQSSGGKEATEQRGWDPDPFWPGELRAEWSPERMGSFMSPWGTVKPRQGSSVGGGGGPAPGAHTAFPGEKLTVSPHFPKLPPHSPNDVTGYRWHQGILQLQGKNSSPLERIWEHKRGRKSDRQTRLPGTLELWGLRIASTNSHRGWAWGALMICQTEVGTLTSLFHRWVLVPTFFDITPYSTLDKTMGSGATV